MNLIFIDSLLITFIIVRVSTHLLHNPKKKKIYTLTEKIRKNTNLEIHHIHFGIILIILSLMINLTHYLIINQGVGLSLIADQIIPLFFKKICYFSKEGIFSAIMVHLIIILISLIIL